VGGKPPTCALYKFTCLLANFTYCPLQEQAEKIILVRFSAAMIFCRRAQKQIRNKWKLVTTRQVSTGSLSWWFVSMRSAPSIQTINQRSTTPEMSRRLKLNLVTWSRPPWQNYASWVSRVKIYGGWRGVRPQLDVFKLPPLSWTYLSCGSDNNPHRFYCTVCSLATIGVWAIFF